MSRNVRTAQILFAVVACCGVAALASLPAQAATDTGTDFRPSATVSAFTATIIGTQSSEGFRVDLAYRGPERYRSFTRNGQARGVTLNLENRGLHQSGAGTRHRLSYALRTMGAIPAEPDGYSSMEYEVLNGVPSALARHRGGTTLLVDDVLNGVPTLRAETPIAANDCAALAAGTVTIWLDAQTLLPLRYRAVQGASLYDYTLRYTNLNKRPVLGTFAPLRARNSTTLNQRFRRVSVASAAAHLPYAPMLPGYLPAGFTRVATGWAPRSAVVGPEGSLPAAPNLFAAVYKRGVERLDFTQRSSTRALRRDWLKSDPFAGECADVTMEDAIVSGHAARFGVGPTTVPHLFWINGRVLHTLSGPYPKAELVMIAESLAKAP